MKKYLNYSTEDFVTDAHFRKWILDGGTISEFRQQFLAHHTEKKESLETAAQMIRLLQFNNPSIDFQIIEEELQSTLQKINTQKTSLHKPLLKYAAAIILICLCGALYVMNTSNLIAHSTNFGEKQNIVLPDGSIVTLNANSHIEYSQNWKKVPSREVALEGEAFFEVKHLQNDSKFIVHTNTFDVEVVGTSFNLVNRSNKHQVMLKEGKVEVHFKDESDKWVSFLDETELQQIRQNKTLKLAPNQLFEASTQERKFIHKKVNPANYVAWLSNKFVCDHLPITALATFIENHYGWKVQIMNPELLTKEINGTIPTDNIEVLLKTLPLILDVGLAIDQPKKQIIFSANPS